MSGGLLIAGQLAEVPGLSIIPPASAGGPSWAMLGPDDYYMRRTMHPHLIVDHTTGGLWPQRVIPGAGPGGHAREIAEMWNGQDHGPGAGIHSGAPILIDFDGTIVCLVDIVYCAAYHAERANEASIGVEHCTTPDGSIYQATLDASVALHRALCDVDGLLAIPFQVHCAPYANAPLARCETGRKTADHDGRVQTDCADIYGILQHRDQTSERGRGDAGDALIAALIAGGAEPINYATGHDLKIGRDRQRSLVAMGEQLVVDGLVGAASLAAAHRRGFARWRDVPSG